MSIKVLFIGGVFAKENIPEIVQQSIGTIEYSANTFQERLIRGFDKNNIDIKVVSAPFIGAYPMRSKWLFFREFEKEQNQYEYVPFLNMWGIRNFTRAYSIKKKIKNFVYENTDDQKIIVVYSAHEPFLEAAAWAKKLNPSIKICFVVPDLPQYMNLDSNKSTVYDILKKVDIARMEKHMKSVDGFVVLTDQMKDVLKIENRPVIVVEGIIDDINRCHDDRCKKSNSEKYIVYTGKLNEKFGIKKLIYEFMKIEKSNYRLVLCGDGDCVSYIKETIVRDERIIYTGQLTPEEARKWQQNADLLVNPRRNDEEYTKYSFPSKTIEYLLTGNTVAAYLLDGMKGEYKDFLYVIPEDTEFGIKETIEKALEDKDTQKKERYFKFKEYVMNNLKSEQIVRAILDLLDQGESE